MAASSWIQCDTAETAQSVTRELVRMMPVQIFFDCTEREHGLLRSTDQGASFAVLVHDYDKQGDGSVGHARACEPRRARHERRARVDRRADRPRHQTPQTMRHRRNGSIGHARARARDARASSSTAPSASMACCAQQTRVPRSRCSCTIMTSRATAQSVTRSRASS